VGGMCAEHDAIAQGEVAQLQRLKDRRMVHRISSQRQCDGSVPGHRAVARERQPIVAITPPAALFEEGWRNARTPRIRDRVFVKCVRSIGVSRTSMTAPVAMLNRSAASPGSEPTTTSCAAQTGAEHSRKILSRVRLPCILPIVERTVAVADRM